MAVRDITPPRLTSLTFPASIDAVSYGSLYAGNYPVFSAGATDDGTGVDHVTITLDRSRDPYGGGDTIIIGGSRALFEEGPQSQNVAFDAGASAGIYNISTVAVYDRAGNVATYSAAQLGMIGIATRFTVNSNVAEDTSKPTLTSLALPASVDLVQGQGYVTIVAGARDAGTGPYSVQVTIDHGVGTQTLYRNGDAFSGSFTLYGNAPAGTYHVLAATVTDRAGNAQNYTGAQLEAMQVRTSFAVTSNAPADTTAPALAALTLPAAIDLTRGGATVPIVARVDESGSGLGQIAIAFDGGLTLAFAEYYRPRDGTPIGGPVLSGTIAAGTAGTAYAGELSLVRTGDDYALTYGTQAGIPLSARTADGIYHVTGVTLTDIAGNVSQYGADRLASLGVNTTIRISADGSAPTLTGFDISPIVARNGGMLSVSASATDTGTGPSQVLVHTSFAGSGVYNSGYDANHLVIGVAGGAGTYSQRVEPYTPTGAYDIYDVIVKDGAGNSTLYTADQLHAMGIRTAFAVVTGTAADDFDGNGLSDLLWRNSNGSISTWSTDAGGARQRITQDSFDTKVDPGWHPVESFDWNGDGHGDILWRNDNGGLAIWTGRTGDFAQGAYLDFTVATSWRIAGAGDLNGDGHGDLLWRNADGSISTWLAQGAGFARNVYSHGPVGAGWQIEGLGDFNGDGRADILWRNADGAVSVWNSTGTAFQEGSLLHSPVDRAWHIVGIGDFGADGRDDILWRNDDGRLTVWQGNPTGTGFDEARFAATAPVDWHVAAVADYSGDHRADILWRNDAGAVSIWNSTGTDWQQNSYFAAGVGNDWSIVSHDFLF